MPQPQQTYMLSTGAHNCPLNTMKLAACSTGEGRQNQTDYITLHNNF